MRRLKIRTIVPLVVAAQCAVPAIANAADTTVRRALPSQGRVEITLPSVPTIGRFSARLELTASNGAAFGYAVYGRAKPGERERLMTATYEEIGTDVTVAAAGTAMRGCAISGPACSVVVAGSDVIVGLTGRAAAGSRIVFFWDAASAVLDVTAGRGVRVSPPDRRFFRGTAPVSVTASDVTLHVGSAMEVGGTGGIAIAHLPCGTATPAPAMTGSLYRGDAVVATLACGSRPDVAASGVPGRDSSWTLRGDVAGTDRRKVLLVLVGLG